MRAIVYTEHGDSSVLRLIDRPVPEPGPGHVRVRIVVSGVNPTDWKQRRGSGRATAQAGEQVPNQDGAGVVDAVGAGVPSPAVGQRVWVWDAAWRRPDGTAQEHVVLPVRQVVPLPDQVTFDVGASLGIPALTAHRALTIAPQGPAELRPGALTGRTVLVAGGAGAVGHAAIQLAVWAGADVVSTVSSPEKAALARAAGAQHAVDYRAEDATARIRDLAPGGVDVIVEVDPMRNAALDAAVIAPGGALASYAGSLEALDRILAADRPDDGIRTESILTYTSTVAQKDAAVRSVARAAAGGRLEVGADAGLPLLRFPLDRTAEAHDAVESGAVGKVLVDVTPA